MDKNLYNKSERDFLASQPDTIRCGVISKFYFKVIKGEKMKLGNLTMANKVNYVFFYDGARPLSIEMVNQMLAYTKHDLNSIIKEVKYKEQGYIEVYEVEKTMNRHSKAVVFGRTVKPYPLPPYMKRMRGKDIVNSGYAYPIN